MITYVKREESPLIDCFAGKVKMGFIMQEVDGFYYYYPPCKQGFFPSGVLMDIARKLEALNEAWNIRLNELNVKTDAPNYGDDT
jgi:hypothetical protein